MNRKDKDHLRKIKREIKRSGNKKVRHDLKKALAENPDEAHLTDVDYGSRSSKKMNGMDYDSTRKKKTRHQLYNEEDGGIMSHEQGEQARRSEDQDQELQEDQTRQDCGGKQEEPQ